MLQYIYMNEEVLTRASKQLDKVAPKTMGLAGDNDLVALEDELIQAEELTMPGSTKLALDVCHPPDALGQMSLFSTISVIFENIYISLNLFFFPLGMMLISSLKNISEFSKPPKFLFVFKIFLFLKRI